MQRLRLALGFGAVVVLGLALVLWLNDPPAKPLPFPFVQLTPTWPGEPNYWRDDLRLLGDQAVPPLLIQLKRRSVAEWPVISSLRRKLPPRLGDLIPDDDQAAYRRRVALWSLGEIGSAASNATPALIHVRDTTQEADLRANAIIALAKIHPRDPVVRSNFLALLTSAQQTERFYAAQEFGAVPVQSPDDIAPLIQALSDVDGEVRANAAFSLARFGKWAGPAVPTLQAMLSDTYRHAPFTAAVALAAIGPEYTPVTLAVVTNAIIRKADMSEFMAPAYFRIAGTSAGDAVPWLKSLLDQDSNRRPFRQGWVDLALCQVTDNPPPTAIDQVARLDPPTLPALAALARLGPAASNAVPRLRELERLTVSSTARSAIQATLRQITNSAAGNRTGRLADPNR